MKYIILAVLCALPVAALVLVIGSVKKKKAAQASGLPEAQNAEQPEPAPEEAE